mmetsp:Transcript_31445/g.70737  ORF Transcript_31445/g.70737 Transcript_31445/m.70737 type:complete len:205 (-) Transcript_31445:1984-2598(-)
MDWKLSSRITMSAACCATCVPLMNMANPTSACFSAGASLVPSPVTATTCRDCFIPFPASMVILLFWMPVTSTSLSVGVERARTRSLGQILSNSAWLMQRSGCSAFCWVRTIWRNCSPVRAISLPSRSPSSVRMFAFLEIALAVLKLSPVTMRTTMPASLHVWIAPGTSTLSGSSMPTMQMSVRSLSTLSGRTPSPCTRLSAQSL